MYFDEPAEGFVEMPYELSVVLVFCGLFNILFFVYPGPLDRRGERCRAFPVLMRLDPTAAAAGFRLAAHDVLGSTNAEALDASARQAKKGRSGWLRASRPRAAAGAAGNGSRRREISMRRSLLFDPAPAEAAPQLAFVAGLAVHDAIIELRARS